MPMNDESAVRADLGGLSMRIDVLEKRIIAREITETIRMDGLTRSIDEILFLMRAWRTFWKALAKTAAFCAAVSAAIYYGMSDWRGGR